MSRVQGSSELETAVEEYQYGGENSVWDEVGEFDEVTVVAYAAWRIFEDQIQWSLHWDFDHGCGGGIGECRVVEEYVT